MNVFRRSLLIVAGLSLLMPGYVSFAASAAKKKISKPPPAPITGQVDGYRGIWFTLGQFTKHGDKYSGGLGTYTANHNPMAVYSLQADKTFFTYGGTVKGQRHLLVMASCFDHKTGRVPRPTIVHDKLTVNDPHDNGSIQLDDKGHVWIFVSGRARHRPGFIYRSKEPFSVAAFERVGEREITYPQPWLLAGEGWLHLFTKYTKGRELYWATSRDGVTWSDDRKLAGMGGHYQVSGAHGRKVASFCNYHPGGSVDKRTNLYYVQTEDFGKTWTTADGKPLETPLSEVQNPALVVDYAAQGKLQYTCDLNFDREGRPLLLHVTSRGYAPGPENDPREFCLTRWDGRAWQTTTITKTDHNYDMGSLWAAGGEWRVIAPTLSGPQPYGGGGEMCLWISGDSGKTWTMKKQITRDSPLNHNYARRPRNAHDPFYAFWADGNPDKLSESRLYFCDSTGEHVWQLPYDVTEETAAPQPVRR
ncbi:MAG: BNR-4 repeat-containing protein [Verrucomicrobiia bacterium]